MNTSSFLQTHPLHDPRRLLDAKVAWNGHGMMMLGAQVVQFWERPLMRQLAKFAVSGGCERLLEIGYGAGMCADYVQQALVCEHVVIEAHPTIADVARNWARKQSSTVKIVEGFWQESVANLGLFDAIIFDAAPLIENPAGHYEEFVPIAQQLLRPKGRLTYLSLETALSESHKALLVSNFDHYEVAIVRGLEPPSSCTYWSHEVMAVPCARQKS